MDHCFPTLIDHSRFFWICQVPATLVFQMGIWGRSLAHGCLSCVPMKVIPQVVNICWFYSRVPVIAGGGAIGTGYVAPYMTMEGTPSHMYYTQPATQPASFCPTGLVILLVLNVELCVDSLPHEYQSGNWERKYWIYVLYDSNSEDHQLTHSCQVPLSLCIND